MSPRFRMPGDLPAPPGEGDAPAPDSPLLVQLLLSRAAQLAREGRHEEAVGVLAGLRVSARQAVPAYHLAARIRAQTGHYEEAVELWTRVLQVEPGHAGALAGQREIQRLRRRPLWLSSVLTWPLAIAVLAAAFLLRPRGDGIERVLAEQKRLAAELELLRASLAPAAAPPDFDPGELPVVAELRGEARLLRFKTPLFDAGSRELRPEARALLGLLAERLAGKAQVTAVGYAVEPVHEARAQARARAAAVAEILRADVLDLPGGEAPGPAEAVALRLTRVKR